MSNVQPMSRMQLAWLHSVVHKTSGDQREETEWGLPPSEDIPGPLSPHSPSLHQGVLQDISSALKVTWCCCRGLVPIVERLKKQAGSPVLLFYALFHPLSSISIAQSLPNWKFGNGVCMFLIFLQLHGVFLLSKSTWDGKANYASLHSSALPPSCLAMKPCTHKS